MTAQEILALAMQESGVKICSVKVERYLAARSECDCVNAIAGADSKGWNIQGRKVTVRSTGEERLFKTAKEACMFMAQLSAQGRDQQPAKEATALTAIESVVLELESRMSAFDENLNETGTCPTGDDYNTLYATTLNSLELMRTHIENARNAK